MQPVIVVVIPNHCLVFFFNSCWFDLFFCRLTMLESCFNVGSIAVQDIFFCLLRSYLVYITAIQPAPQGMLGLCLYTNNSIVTTKA